jgi:transcriptional regulator with XRE-family HTH domain
MVKYKHRKGVDTMFGKNLKYYRLKNNMSMKELAELVQVPQWPLVIMKKKSASLIWR